MQKILRGIVAALAAFLIIFATAQPASAHDEILTSSPAPGEQLDTAPEMIELRYSAELMDAGAIIMVLDETGKDWAIGDPVIDRETVSIPLEADMPVAGYEVRWRVVSSDGHPIDGAIPFTIGDADPFVGVVEATSEPTPTAAEQEQEQEQVQETAAPQQSEESSTGSQDGSEDQGASRALLVGGSAAAIVVVILALVMIRRRRAHRNDSSSHDA